MVLVPLEPVAVRKGGDDPRLDLASYPYLPKAAVQATRAADYTALLDQEAA